MKKKYTLHWLDYVLTEYDPAKINEDGLSQTGIDTLLADVEKQSHTLRVKIHEEVHRAARRNAIKPIVRYYHTAITHYMNEIYECKVRVQSNKVCSQFYGLLLEQLDTLLRFISSHFSGYLGKAYKVPKIYLRSAKEELRTHVDAFRNRQKSIKEQHVQAVSRIVSDALERFINTERYTYHVTYQCVRYRLRLVRKLEEMNSWDTADYSFLSPLDQLLIYLNFNSKAYLDYLKMRIVREICLAGEEPSRQIELLLDLRKRFRTLHYRPDESGFNPEYQDIVTFFENFFEQEITCRLHLKEKQAYTVGNDLLPKTSDAKKAAIQSKVQVALSSDQTALLLRAADEARILSARSMTEVFRTIIPNISTTARKELSFESVRIKSYNPEDRDKEIAIEALQKMIRKIREY